MSSSSSSSLLQSSISQLSSLLWPPPLFLSSELHAQLNVILPLLPIGSGAAAAPHAVTAFHGAALQAYQHCAVRCQKE